MDTSKEYIKMCEKAQDIQLRWKPQEGDWVHFYEVIENVRGVDGVVWPLTEQKAMTRVIFLDDEDGSMAYSYNGTSYYPSANYLEGRVRTWLPRQDQLQEMAIRYGKDPKPEYWSMLLFGFDPFIKNEVGRCEYVDKIPFHSSMEQLWLAFAMQEKYARIWNGEDWIISNEHVLKMEKWSDVEDKKKRGWIDLGPYAECVKCGKRVCHCIERQNGTWENILPIHYDTPKQG